MVRLIGLILLVGGAALLYVGWEEKESFASEVSEAIQGSPTDRSLMFLGGGGVAVLLGLGLLLKGGKKG